MDGRPRARAAHSRKLFLNVALTDTMQRPVQEWETVTLRKSSPAAKPGSAAGAPAAPDPARKLDEQTENVAHARVSQELRMAIQRARLAKKMPQKDLAAQISEKPGLVNDYESGRAIPTPHMINKLSRALGVKLPRK